MSDGARKAALFLSILDPDSAETLLRLFDPDVANIIAEEAKRIERVSPEDVEKVVSEFLAATGMSNADFARVLFNGKASPSIASRQETNIESSGETPVESNGVVCSLDFVESDKLAAGVADESAAICAVVLSLLSQRVRDSFLNFLPREKADAALRLEKVLATGKSATKMVEDALFERALEDE